MKLKLTEAYYKKFWDTFVKTLNPLLTRNSTKNTMQNSAKGYDHYVLATGSPADFIMKIVYQGNTGKMYTDITRTGEGSKSV